MTKQKSAYDRTLAAWRKEWCEENLTPETNKLINLANYDLYYGPVGDGAVGDPDADGNENEWAGYPGFVSACKTISEALADLPRQLWFDIDAEYWQDSEPTSEPCEERDAHGEHPESCDVCDGSGYIEPFWEAYYSAEHDDLMKAIVGKELASYL